MNLDDMACVGCTDNIILSSTIGRNKNLIPGEVISTLIQATTDILAQLKRYGVNVHLAGGETADVGDIVRTIDVGYTAFARMKRSDVIENNIQAGDVIVGLASYGQTSYETSYNGGMGSNGLTSARHDVFQHEYLTKYPDSFDSNTPEDVIYVGKRKLTDTIELDGRPIEVGKLVLSPTRTYLPILQKILPELRPHIHGIIHNTGGGQTKVLKFIQNKTVVKNNLFPIPPLFQLIKQESGTSLKEMYQVFNMGHRLEIYLPYEHAETVIETAKEFFLEAQIVGYVAEGEGQQVRIETPYGNFEYK